MICGHRFPTAVGPPLHGETFGAADVVRRALQHERGIESLEIVEERAVLLERHWKASDREIGTSTSAAGSDSAASLSPPDEKTPPGT